MWCSVKYAKVAVCGVRCQLLVDSKRSGTSLTRKRNFSGCKVTLRDARSDSRKIFAFFTKIISKIFAQFKNYSYLCRAIQKTIAQRF